jgi:hypothetical protein
MYLIHGTHILSTILTAHDMLIRARLLIDAQREFSAANLVVVFWELLWEMEMFPWFESNTRYFLSVLLENSGFDKETKPASSIYFMWLSDKARGALVLVQKHPDWLSILTAIDGFSPWEPTFSTQSVIFFPKKS